jgi:hypothetical protein
MNLQRPTSNIGFLLALGLLSPITVWANPVSIDGTSLLAFGIVTFWAFVVEAGIVALLLAFSGVEPLRLFGGFFATNFLVFTFLFCPLLHRLPLAPLETLVVAVDGAAIKWLTCFGSFQQDDFRGVSWLHAGVISAVGNAASFFVGVIASGAPWVQHSIAE